jgi:hypothetical protein
MNCGPLSEMIQGFALWVKFLGALQDDLDVRLGHRLPQTASELRGTGQDDWQKSMGQFAG